tara:strand:+ start:169 stop:909 length:741 start_codon:yes stop_codon:yes gene_type:complete
MTVEKITISAIGTLVTLHSGDTTQPFPENLLSQPNLDQFALSSCKRGLPPIFLNNGVVDIQVENKTADELFTKHGIHDIPVGYGMELLALQIKYFSEKFVYHLKTKIDLSFEKLINEFLTHNPDYKSEDYEAWLNWYQRNEFYEKGINFLAKLRGLNEDAYINEILQRITDPDYGVRAWVKNEINDDNIHKLNKKYTNWSEDIIVIMNGKFHIELAITDQNKLEFSFKSPSEILSVFIRNYDEDPI